MLEEIELLDKQLREVTANRKQRIAEIQDSCTHPFEYIREGMWREGSSGYSSIPEFRVCTLCGYSEEGWGCGFWKLAYHGQEIPKLSRESAIKFVKDGIQRQDEMNKKRFKH
jgi:hypothetical protein